MKNFLLIDTIGKEDSFKLSIIDQSGKEVTSLPSQSRDYKSILRNIGRILGAVKLEGIYVVNGPGNFSQVRQGVAFANALAWALSLPVKCGLAGQPRDFSRGWSNQLARPVYTKDPNITKARRV